MNTNFRIQLLKLTDGRRLMRIEDDSTGLCVERKLAADAPVVAQKAKLLRLFEALLAGDAAAA